MNAGRVLAISRKVFLTLKHDPRTVALMLLAPVMAMLIFGFAFGSETRDVRTVVVNDDEGDVAQGIIDKLDRDALQITIMTDAAAARASVQRGENTAAILFPANFTADASPTEGTTGTPGPAPGLPGTPPVPPQPPKGARAEVFLDTTNNQLAGVVLRELQEATVAYAEEGGRSAPIAFDPAYAHPAAKDARFIDYFVPGVMAFAATLFTTLLTLLAFVGERANGTLDRLRVTPVTEAEFVLGYVLAFGLIAAVQGALLLAVAILVYDVLIVGSVALAALIIVLMAVDAMGIGILVSSAAQREGQAIQFVPFIVLPVFLLSGIFVPVEALPAWLRPLSYLLPPTWAIEALRDVMLRGWGLDRVGLHVAILAGFAAVFTTLAILGLKRARQA